jgi:type I restriction enzyme S subunit
MSKCLRLGDLVTIERGTTYKSALVGQPGPVLLGLASIKRNGGFRSDSLRTYGGDSPDRLLVRPGQLYASLKDLTQAADLLGSVARVPADSPVGRLTQDTVRLDLVSDLVTADYVYWCLRTPQYRAYCRAHATGTTNLGLPREDFLDFEIPEATPWRLALVEAIGALDDLIDTNRRIVDAVARQSRVAFSRCSRIAPHTVSLRSVAVVNEHKTSAGTGTIQYLDIASLGEGVIEWPEPIDWSVAPTRARRLAKVGDTLWSTVRPNRRSHALLLHAPDNLVVSTGIAVLTPTAIGPAYLYAATDDQAFVDQLVSRADGSAYPAVRADAFEAATIPLPSADQLHQFEVAMWPLWLAVAELQEEAQTAARARDELLPLLLTGRVQVGDGAA